MVRRDARDVNVPRLQVDDEEHEVVDEATDGERLDAEEVGRGDGAPVRLQERLPRQGLAPQGSGLDAVLGEDALDGGASEVDANVLERAAKARVTPGRIGARHREQLRDRVPPRRWAARPAPGASVVLGSH
jgi:hypothetical protein